MPTVSIAFVSDNAAFPYGTKEDDWLLDRVRLIATQIEQQLNPDIFIVACNTASTVALPALRSCLNIPVVGVVPAIKPAAQLSLSKHLALVATPATVRRVYTDNLIEEFAHDCQVTRIGTSELVEIAEQKLRGEAVDTKQVETILYPIIENKDIDTVVLACTHFPLLINEIGDVLKANTRKVEIIDSSLAIAERVKALLLGSTLESLSSDPIYSAYFTKIQASTKLKTSLYSRGICEVATLV